ncbi:kinase-like domain-containing protein [Mucor mucedo]|uniref:kinase-like domain-containing protein n=1 Tax=Mucor mucedo TaxID=29922 RepID=UPI00221E8AA8|nr:kinase-like domain-containing protein [Mucor mucedo]KAI7896845.1 kinase-like domain-containing protein [Mucor mucedo]
MTLSFHRKGNNVEKTEPKPEKQSNTTASGNQDSYLNGIGSYEFIKSLGSGKFSKVMLAYHLETHQQVAIKIIDKQAHDYRVMSRLVREISIMEILQHEYIVKLYETFESCDSLFLVMEYVPGWNLDEYLQKKSQGALDEDEARHLFRQLVTAVDFCHRKWVVHRDLKTPNILITPDGQVKLADFGLGNRYGLQRLRTICGSMLYYSPEIITGQKYYGPEVDCWCLGITLFRMTAGFEPFSHAHTVGELKKDVCKCNFPMPSTLSSGLQATIRKCLQVDRRKRMTLRQVLKDDPWLTDNGRLHCPVSIAPKTVFEETMVMQEGDREDRDNKTRKQFMKDLERDAQTANKVRRTVIYHPLNTSTYYTTKAGSSQSMAAAGAQVQNVELLRSELLQSIRSRARKLGMKSAERWDTLKSPGLKSLLFSSFHHKKKDSLFATSSQTSNSTSSSRSLSEMVQRITKDQVYHFQLTNHHQYTHSSRPPSLSSSTSTSSLSSSIDARDSAVAAIEDEILSIEKKSSREVMALLKQTCQLMGITYVQDSPVSLHCVLTLRSTPKTTARTSSSATLLSPSTSNSPAPPPISAHTRKQSQTSSMGTMMGGDESSSNRKRLSLPLISHLTSSMTTSFFGRSKPRHSMDETSTVNKSVSPDQTRRKQKEGTAMFTIQLESHKKKVDRVSLRFSKQQGSTTVFKMAGGWVAGVVALDGKIGR